jgi:hypothetical protein
MAVIDISSAISAMNSRNGRGSRAAVASEMGVSCEVKRAYVTIVAGQAAPWDWSLRGHAWHCLA